MSKGPPASAIPDIDHEGFLLKLGAFVKSWKQRYFVLKNNELFYYRSASAASPVGIIRLNESSSVSKDDSVKDKPWGLSLRVEGRTYVLIAESELEQTEWVAALGKAIAGDSEWVVVEEEASSSSEEERVTLQLPSEERAAALLAASVAPARRSTVVRKIKEYRIAVVGMWCPSCKVDVEEKLGGNLESLEVDLEAGVVTVTCYDVEKVTKVLEEELGFICHVL